MALTALTRTVCVFPLPRPVTVKDRREPATVCTVMKLPLC
jgi:hypothetical protein